jgi:hypothetical protein
MSGLAQQVFDFATKTDRSGSPVGCPNSNLGHYPPGYWTSFNFHSLALASDLWHDVDAMTIGKGKRPRDPNQLAAWTVAVSTGQIPAEEPMSAPPVSAPATSMNISEYMRAIGRKGGQIGGKRRLKTMTQEQRRKVAAKAAKARWKKAKNR